jgi:hypothetical protein
MTWIDWYNSLAKPAWTPAPQTIGTMADHLPDHSGQLWSRALAMDAGQNPGNGRAPIRHQPRCQSALHNDSIQNAQLAVGGARYPDCLGNNHLVRGGHLAAPEMGCLGTDTLLCLGLNRDLAATLDHHSQLG